MRILIVSGIFPPDIGGPARYVPTMAAKLAERGHAVTVVTLADDPAIVVPSYPFALVRIGRGLPRLRRLWRVVMTIRQLARAGDVVLANTLGFEAALAGMLARRPVVHKVVGDYAWERARNQGLFPGTIDDYQTAKKSVRLRLLDAWRNWPLRRAARVIMPSEYLRRLVIGWGVPASRTEVIYNAFEAGRRGISATSSRGNQPTIVTTVCRLVPWKGVAGIIEAVAMLPNHHLQIVGDGPLLDEMTALAARLGAADRVRFLGRLEEAAVQEVLRRSDVFVLNSSYEGLPHVVLEAMAADVPVVASAVGGTPEVVHHGETGLLVRSRDKEALVDALRRLAENSELRERLTAGGRALLAGEFSMIGMIDRTEACLSAVAGRVCTS